MARRTDAILHGDDAHRGQQGLLETRSVVAPHALPQSIQTDDGNETKSGDGACVALNRREVGFPLIYSFSICSMCVTSWAA